MNLNRPFPWLNCEVPIVCIEGIELYNLDKRQDIWRHLRELAQKQGDATKAAYCAKREAKAIRRYQEAYQNASREARNYATEQWARDNSDLAYGKPK